MNTSNHPFRSAGAKKLIDWRVYKDSVPSGLSDSFQRLRRSRRSIGEGCRSFPKRIASQKILTQVGNGIVQRLARITGAEAEFARGLGAVEVPEVLRHLDRARLDRRSKVPLPEERVDNLRAGHHEFRR